MALMVICQEINFIIIIISSCSGPTNPTSAYLCTDLSSELTI